VNWKTSKWRSSSANFSKLAKKTPNPKTSPRQHSEHNILLTIYKSITYKRHPTKQIGMYYFFLGVVTFFAIWANEGKFEKISPGTANINTGD